ncbi:hypothetical protein FA13DRAFT_98250 [Coprinellus micaceus]|uniref:Uncharacterized protein n=1 Tax=Coprinellus micaceus TaxID=71717 RepID=A0A4Y7SIJ7_COPMI|nr:hypothetical protein FA13DRAFT_98250 [Coprinellus micaceus]
MVIYSCPFEIVPALYTYAHATVGVTAPPPRSPRMAGTHPPSLPSTNLPRPTGFLQSYEHSLILAVITTIPELLGNSWNKVDSGCNEK